MRAFLKAQLAVALMYLRLIGDTDPTKSFLNIDIQRNILNSDRF